MSDNFTWSAVVTDVIPFDGQDLTVGFSTDPEDPEGTVIIKGTGSSVLLLPNSTQASPTWNDIPGTSPVLQARQDGHFPASEILIRYRDGQALSQGGTIPEANTVFYNRPALVDPPTAADAWQLRYNGVRVVYGNEYNCLRVRGIPDDQVPARFMSHATRDNTAHPIMQASLSDAATHKFQVYADGQILNETGLDMNPTAPVAVSFTSPAGNAATISDGVSSGAPYAVTTVLFPAFNRVYLNGAVANNGGAPITGGTVLFTITAAHRPASWVQFNERTSTTLSARVTVRPDGTVRLDQALAVGATVSFDGLNWAKA